MLNTINLSPIIFLEFILIGAMSIPYDICLNLKQGIVYEYIDSLSNDELEELLIILSSCNCLPNEKKNALRKDNIKEIIDYRDMSWENYQEISFHILSKKKNNN